MCDLNDKVVGSGVDVSASLLKALFKTEAERKNYEKR